jgi:hypothetical protein
LIAKQNQYKMKGKAEGVPLHWLNRILGTTFKLACAVLDFQKVFGHLIESIATGAGYIAQFPMFFDSTTLLFMLLGAAGPAIANRGGGSFVLHHHQQKESFGSTFFMGATGVVELRSPCHQQ